MIDIQQDTERRYREAYQAGYEPTKASDGRFYAKVPGFPIVNQPTLIKMLDEIDRLKQISKQYKS